MDIVTQSKHLMLSVGAAPVLWLMIGLSIVSLAIIVERSIALRTPSHDFAALVDAFTERLHELDLDAARRALESSRAPEAWIVLKGLDAAPRGSSAAREAIAGATAIQRARYERGLGFLGTLGNNAPFVGLFGTVIGIMLAFDELARAGASTTSSARLMDSIAEALVATAIGLLVAIPAVFAFNGFQRRIKRWLTNVDALSHLLLTHLEGHGETRVAASVRTLRAAHTTQHDACVAEGA